MKNDWSQTKVSEPVFEKLKKLRKQSIAAQQNIKSPCGRSPAAAWRRSGKKRVLRRKKRSRRSG